MAGRYAREWENSYWPCKAEAVRTHSARHFFRVLTWTKCRPEALAAHDAAHGTGGPGQELTPPLVLRMLYPAAAAPKVILVVRNPTDRFETSFWLHPHYPKHYGASVDGLHAHAAATTDAFARCDTRFGSRRCAFLFENLDRDFKGTFFACDQVIRGIYWPFVADWHAAFGARAHARGLLVLRAEELLDSPTAMRPRVLDFVGLPTPAAPESTIATPPKYAVMHAATLSSYGGVPMHNSTRRLLETFYAPHNRRLAQLLEWGDRVWTRSSVPSTQDWAEGKRIRYQRYGSYESKPTVYDHVRV